jgi:DNA-binding FadR family transcriptional regulator
MSARTRTELIDLLEERLEAFIAGVEAVELPPLQTLARRFGVSPPTLRKAAARLAARGIIETGRGRRMRRITSLAAAPAQGETATPSPGERAYQFIRRRLEDGAYRAGEELPKQIYFAMHLHVSLRTIRKAYRRLRAEGCIHPRGRTYIVGREQSHAAVIAQRIRPTVLVCSASIHDWAAQYASRRTSRFVSTFIQQMEQQGVNLIEAQYDPRLKTFCTRDYARTPAPAEGAIRGLGEYYRGAVVAAADRNVPALMKLMQELLRFDKPVVWFDRYDESQVVKPKHPLLARCHFSERAAAALALDTLCDLGHRRIGYIAPFEYDWAAARGDLLQQAGRLHRPAPSLPRFPSVRQLLTPERFDELASSLEAFFAAHAVIERICRTVERRIPEVLPDAGRRSFGAPRRGWVHNLLSILTYLDSPRKFEPIPNDLHEEVRLAILTPYMLQFLRCHVTACIMCRDLFAPRICQWLQLAGCDIPARMSVLSFDNTFSRKPAGLASIDFGFGYLGYAAAHFIIGDVPVRRSRSGDIAALPHVSQWSTLAAAPAHGRLLRPRAQ